MTKDKPRNMAASVRQRLLNLARERHEDFQFVLIRFSLERLLYRLSRSKHRDAFALKGAMLFQLWSDQPHRPTRDLDLLGHGEISIARFEELFREIVSLPVEDDGLTFALDSVQGSVIKEDQEYEGLRITLACRLEQARIPVQIDIGFGDVITPAAAEISYPALLDLPSPSLLAYSRETVVAEKFQAMVMLGIANSRMKDFYDIWILCRRFEFDGSVLRNAIRATFDRRRTSLPNEMPMALTPEFYESRDKQAQWKAFLRKSRLETPLVSLRDVVLVLREFLMPPTQAAGDETGWRVVWPPSGPWRTAGGLIG